MSSDFAQLQTKDLLRRVDAAGSTSVVGVPGSGITIFLKHLSSEFGTASSYIDVSSLPTPSAKEFYSALLNSLGGITAESDSIEIIVARSKWIIQERLERDGRVVIIIASFDHLRAFFSADFFHYLQVLHAVDSERVVFIFGCCQKLDSLLPPDLIDTNIRLFSSTHYLRPYNEHDCMYLLSKYGAPHGLSQDALSELINLSGGHFQLLQLLVNSEYKNSLIDDIFIQLVFKNILSHLSTSQKNTIKKLVVSGKYETAEPYLKNVGIVVENKGSYVLFSELFTEYIKKYHTLRLPIKERRLLAALRKSEGKVVTKHALYDAVWRGREVGSEWALNALIYRLRRHPAFRSQSYSIENHKKVGYVLTNSQ